MTTSTPMLHKVNLTEAYYTPVMEDKIDPDNSIIRDVKIIGKVSNNGRTYTDEALRNAVPLYEGIQVNIDHPHRREATKERGLMEQVGVLRDVRWTPEGNFGNLHLFENHSATKLILERAQKDKNGFGLSHNADGTCVRTKQGEICESIDHARSVDIVGKPATTRGLFESEDPDVPEEKTMKKFSLKQLVESHGSADEKKHLTLLEDASVLDREVELEEDAVSVKSGFGKAIAELHESDDTEGISKLLAARQALKSGPPETPPEPPSGELLESLQNKVQELEAKNKRMELEKEIQTLCESESFRPDEFQMETLSLLESADKRIKLIHTWKQAGKPSRSGRKEVLEDVGSYEEEYAALHPQT